MTTPRDLTATQPIKCLLLRAPPHWIARRAIITVLLTVLVFMGLLGYRAHMHSGWQQQERLVLAALGEPVGAEFRRGVRSLREAHVYCGEVNAYLDEGGMSGFTHYIVHLAQDTEVDTLAQHPLLLRLLGERAVRIEPSLLSSAGEAEALLFAEAWRHYC